MESVVAAIEAMELEKQSGEINVNEIAGYVDRFNPYSNAGTFFYKPHFSTATLRSKMYFRVSHTLSIGSFSRTTGFP